MKSKKSKKKKQHKFLIDYEEEKPDFSCVDCYGIVGTKGKITFGHKRFPAWDGHW
jgi:hypothetical protein